MTDTISNPSSTQRQPPGDLIRAEQGAQFERWHMPVLELVGSQQVVASRQRRQQERAPDQAGGVEDLLTQPLTASRIAAIREQARQEGFAEGQEEGHRAGMTQARAEIDRAVSGLNKIMAQLSAPLAEQEQDIERALLALAVQVAHCLVGRQVNFDENMLTQMIRHALGQLGEVSEGVRITVNPADAALISEATQAQLGGINLQSDPGLARGGCIVKTEQSFLDFTLDTQFRLMLDELLRRQNPEDGAGAEGQKP